ncbi:MAG: GIY-YIG nuclease family protein [Thermaerobacter sp.]|nr:GIY-YIG nuclease family protein [Thermaerobacter sp.]
MSTQTGPGQRGDRVVCRYGDAAVVTAPVQILESATLSSHAVRLYGLIASCLSIERTNPSRRHLAEDMGVSMPTVGRALRELVAVGLVQVRPIVDVRGLRIGSVYTLLREQGDPLLQSSDDKFDGETKRSMHFIQREGGGIKIGVSADVAGRLRMLQAASTERLVLLGTHPGGADLERALHDRSRDQRVRGEWFRPSPEPLRLACGGEHLASTRIQWWNTAFGADYPDWLITTPLPPAHPGERWAWTGSALVPLPEALYQFWLDAYRNPVSVDDLRAAFEPYLDKGDSLNALVQMMWTAGLFMGGLGGTSMPATRRGR